MKAWLYSLGGVVAYLAMTVVAVIIFVSNDVNRPLLRALLWPVTLIRYLCVGLN